MHVCVSGTSAVNPLQLIIIYVHTIHVCIHCKHTQTGHLASFPDLGMRLHCTMHYVHTDNVGVCHTMPVRVLEALEYAHCMYAHVVWNSVIYMYVHGEPFLVKGNLHSIPFHFFHEKFWRNVALELEITNSNSSATLMYMYTKFEFACSSN